MSRIRQELQEHLGDEKVTGFFHFSPPAGQATAKLHPLFGLIYPNPFNKSILSTYYVPGARRTNVKTDTPVCPQGAPLTW